MRRDRPPFITGPVEGKTDREREEGRKRYKFFFFFVFGTKAARRGEREKTIHLTYPDSGKVSPTASSCIYDVPVCTSCQS
jgi:hypothetical protein